MKRLSRDRHERETRIERELLKGSNQAENQTAEQSARISAKVHPDTGPTKRKDSTSTEKQAAAMASTTIRNTHKYWRNCKKMGALYFIIEVPINVLSAYTSDPSTHLLCRTINYFLLAMYSSLGTFFLMKYCFPMLVNVRKKARRMFKMR